MLYRNKKINDPCEGKWVGIGGKFEEGETAQDCLLREVREETGLTLTAFEPRGVVHFLSDRLPDEDMYLFSATAWEGEISLCSEGTLAWISKKDVLSLNLWEGDRYFLEPMLQGETKIALTCQYEGDRLVSCINHKTNTTLV